MIKKPVFGSEGKTGHKPEFEICKLKCKSIFYKKALTIFVLYLAYYEFSLSQS